MIHSFFRERILDLSLDDLGDTLSLILPMLITLFNQNHLSLRLKLVIFIRVLVGPISCLNPTSVALLCLFVSDFVSVLVCILGMASIIPIFVL